MKYTKENIQEGIKATINALPITSIDKELLMLSIPQSPIEIEQNVLEWINNEPLTDINCHGESIVKTMQAWGFSNKDIPQIICGFVDFKDSNWRISNHIWQAVTGLEIVFDGEDADNVT